MKDLIKRYTKFLLLQLLIAFMFSADLKAQSPIQQFDDRTLIDLQMQRTPPETNVFLFLSNSARYVELGIPAGLFIGGVAGHNMEMRQNSAFVASSTLLSIGFTMLIKHVVKRRRPFIQNIDITPVYRAGGTSFPSGHTSSTFASATALSMAYPKWYVIVPSYLWASSVGYSRMYLGVHYPSDVGAGMLLGAGSAVSLSFLKK
ncbi:MAG TPA: phosphatase PAP2 family protein [Mucilaginibacter sp.]